jgi:hypothetical protein
VGGKMCRGTVSHDNPLVREAARSFTSGWWHKAEGSGKRR